MVMSSFAEKNPNVVGSILNMLIRLAIRIESFEGRLCNPRLFCSLCSSSTTFCNGTYMMIVAVSRAELDYCCILYKELTSIVKHETTVKTTKGQQRLLSTQ
jgi:hypothetical protein